VAIRSESAAAYSDSKGQEEEKERLAFHTSFLVAGTFCAPNG
jgi:hypothetical protein